MTSVGMNQPSVEITDVTDGTVRLVRALCMALFVTGFTKALSFLSLRVVANLNARCHDHAMSGGCTDVTVPCVR